MRSMIGKAFLFGYVVTLSPILLGPLIAMAAQWYVTSNIAGGLLERDLCTFALSAATMVELGAIGISVLWMAALVGCIDRVMDKFSNKQLVVSE